MTSDFTGKRHGMLWLWWRSKATLAINVSVTGLALVIYWTTFVGERPTPIFDFIHRTELAGLDARFQIRGPAPPDDRIVIVDIDQHSQEILGRWPFPRSHFATLVDVLREAGARVVAFDISFSQPDDSVRPIRQMQARLEERRKQGRGVDAGVLEEFTRLEEELNYDRKFAEAIGRFGKVVLGNFFLYTEADLQGLDRQALDRYAERAAYYPFPQVRATRSAQGPQSYARLIQIYKDRELLPRGAEANLEVLTSALPADTSATGFFNVFADPDGVVRRGQLALPYGRSSDYSEWDMYASIDVQAVRFFLNLMEREVVLNYGRVGIESIEFGPRKIVPDDLGRVLINYRGPARTYAYYSFADVVKGRFPRGAFRGKIVLVGASATGIADLRASPFGAVNFPGVEIHANVMDNILNQKFLQRGVPQVLADQVFIFLFGIPLGVWLGSVRPRWMALGLLLLVPFAGLVYFAFTRGWWLNAVTPAALTLLPNVGLVAIYRLLVEERERRKTRGAFQQFLSPEVVRRLLQNPELVGPRRTEITVLFSDIRDFTSISERLEAKEVAALLNDYFTSMTEVIFHHQGTLDKYIGDMIMAFWGAPYEEPGHSAKGCRASLAMLTLLDELHQRWRAEGKPLLRIGIGLNTGIAAVGNMGSSLRYGYTALGDTVNLASRLEGLNKLYGTRILVSESAYAAVSPSDLLFRELDLIRVKGKSQPVTIYELMALRDGCGELAERVEVFHGSLVAYKRRDWRQAHHLFEQFLARWPGDGPGRVFLRRCEEFLREEPAPDWDGVYLLTTK